MRAAGAILALHRWVGGRGLFFSRLVRGQGPSPDEDGCACCCANLRS